MTIVELAQHILARLPADPAAAEHRAELEEATRQPDHGQRRTARVLALPDLIDLRDALEATRHAIDAGHPDAARGYLTLASAILTETGH